MLHPNMTVNASGHLAFAGMDTIELAKKYGTPLYLMDENGIRQACREYKRNMKRFMGGASRPVYASKALSFVALAKIMEEEEMDVEVVSPGEILVALKGGIDPKNLYFNGNNKTDADIEYAIEKGVGYFIVDNFEELRSVGAIATAHGITQKVFMRITPGIDPHTFEAVNTGRINCQFGVPIATGQAEQFVAEALHTPGVFVAGYHCHIGSQIFYSGPYQDAAAIMLRFVADMKERYNWEPEILDLGGGPGVRYVETDPVLNIPLVIEQLGEFIRRTCADLGLKMPTILMEPGRSIVAANGMTLYTVGTVKALPAHKNYVSIDGGMSDNPRYALYASPYTVLNADRPEQDATFLCTLAGRCCESGALIQEDIVIRRPTRGDIMAVAVTGAYNYSMASNYNRIGRPPIVMLRDGESYVAVRRETIEDQISRDIY